MGPDVDVEMTLFLGLGVGGQRVLVVDKVSGTHYRSYFAHIRWSLDL
jgi:hypothetical protein